MTKNEYGIPRRLHQVWIGVLPPPTKWLKTWQDMNPNWEYIYWDNEKVFSRKWRNQHIIDHYISEYKKNPTEFKSSRGITFKGEKATLFHWHVIADVLRYEILYEYGGYMPGADTVCLRSIDDKFDKNTELYTLRTGNLFVKYRKKLELKYPNGQPIGKDKLLWDRYDYDCASPILACKKGNKFVGQLVNELNKLKIEDLGEAVDTTGNVFMSKMIKKYKPKIDMPDYVLRGDRVNPYSIHFAGTTKNNYGKGR